MNFIISIYHSYRFTNIVVKWPVATQDAFILANSNIPAVMENQNGWLLGDSGYGLKKWLMTPLLNPNAPQEVRYNKTHCKSRNTVGRAFGVLKAGFRYMFFIYFKTLNFHCT